MPNDYTTKFPDNILRCVDDVDEKGNEMQTSLMLRREIPQFRTAFFNRSMMLFNNWRLFKQSPPNGEGFANERSTICEILAILFDEDNKYTEWEREKERARYSKK